MSRICSKCGAEIQDDALFCGKCGNQVEEQAAAVQTTSDSSETSKSKTLNDKLNDFIARIKNKDKKSIAVVSGIAAVLILILVLSICFSVRSTPEKALKLYMDVILHGEYNKIEKLAPDAYWEAMEDSFSLKDAKEQAKTIYKSASRAYEDEYGDNIKITYKIKEKDDVKKSTFDDMKDFIKSTYDIPKKNITDACSIEIELFIKGSEDEDSNETELYAVKIDGTWYICSQKGLLLGF